MPGPVTVDIREVALLCEERAKTARLPLALCCVADYSATASRLPACRHMFATTLLQLKRS